MDTFGNIGTMRMFAKNYEKSESFVNTSGPMYAMRVYFLIDPYIIYFFVFRALLVLLVNPERRDRKEKG